MKIYNKHLHVLIECLVIWYKMYKLWVLKEGGEKSGGQNTKNFVLCVYVYDGRCNSLETRILQIMTGYN